MKQIIPGNKKGKAVDLEHSEVMSDAEEATALFQLACRRLQQPATWHELGGKLTASFSLVDDKQHTLDRPAALNDHIQIKIPAPGHDWVQVKKIGKEKIDGADESFVLTLKVSPEPGKDTAGVDHFFSEGASSTFIIKREGNKVTASYHGRNEIPNTDSLRNTIVAIGAMAGLSELQWTVLLKGLLEH